MTIDATEAAIRTVIAGAIVESYDATGRAIDALLAMRQAHAIIRPLPLPDTRSSGPGQPGDDPGA